MLSIFVVCLLQGMMLFTLSEAVAPPNMPETFTATGELEVHGPARTAFGECKCLLF